LPLVQDLSLIGNEISGQKVEESGFPGPIGAENSRNFVFIKLIVNFVNSDDVAKAFGDALGFEDD
jgi:hypothetical protein